MPTDVAMTSDNRRESRLRAALKRQGYRLRKDRAWTVSLDHQGGYMIVDPNRNLLVAGEHFDLDLDDVQGGSGLRTNGWSTVYGNAGMRLSKLSTNRWTDGV
jgi:hypothetical protein